MRMTPTIPHPSDVVKLPLSVADVYTVLIDGIPHIVFRPAVEALGVSYPRQYRKLKTRSWATVAQTYAVAADGKLREMDTVPVQTFMMWLATVNENRVSEIARPTLIAYQCETADAVEAYWTRGGAINPRADTEQLAALEAHVIKQTAMIRELIPDAQTWRMLAAEGGDFSVRDAAAILNRDHTIVTGQNMLFAYMRGCRMLDRKNRPYADHKHHLVRRMGVEYIDQFGETHIGGSQVRVTVEGLAYLHRRLSRPVPA